MSELIVVSENLQRTSPNMDAWSRDRDIGLVKRMETLLPLSDDRVLLDGAEFEDLVRLADQTIEHDGRLKELIDIAKDMIGQIALSETVIISKQAANEWLEKAKTV